MPLDSDHLGRHFAVIPCDEEYSRRKLRAKPAGKIETIDTEHNCHATFQGLQLYGEIKLIIQQQED